MKTVTLIDGYAKGKSVQWSEYRVVELDEVISWSVPVSEKCTCDAGQFAIQVRDLDHAAWVERTRGIVVAVGALVMLDCQCKEQGHPGVRYVDITPSHVLFVAQDGKVRRAKVNGKVRTWKRDKRRVELPIKYGMYEYATFNTEDIESGRLVEAV